MSQVNYDDLDEPQKQALIDAFGEPSDYETPLFSEADIKEVAEYSNLRTKLEGLDVNRGNTDSERLEYFTGENGNILKETDEGKYEVNSIWDSWMLEEMEEKDMIDSSKFSFYKAENLEDTDMSVLEVDGSFYLDIEDGVTFSLGSAETVEDAEYDSAEKVQHMTQEFIKQFACGEGEKPGDTGYNNDISSKPEGNSTRINGGENMTEERIPEMESRLKRIGEYARGEGDIDDGEFAGMVDQLSDDVENLISCIKGVESEKEELEETAEERGEAVTDYRKAIEHVNDILLYKEDGEERGLIPQIESRIDDTEETLDDAYETLDGIHDRAQEAVNTGYSSDLTELDDETKEFLENTLENGDEYVSDLEQMKEGFEEEFYGNEE